MFPRSFPAAIAVITVVSLSLPMASASSARPRVHPRNPATPAARVQVRFWHLVLGFFDPTAGAVDAAGTAGMSRSWKALAGDAGCGMDPDGRTRILLAPPTADDRP